MKMDAELGLSLIILVDFHVMEYDISSIGA